MEGCNQRKHETAGFQFPSFHHVGFREEGRHSIHLLNGRARGAAPSAPRSRKSTRHPSWHAASPLVQLGNDGVANILQLLLLVLILVLFCHLGHREKRETAVTELQDMACMPEKSSPRKGIKRQSQQPTGTYCLLLWPCS